MITLRTNPYTVEELEMLEKVLSVAEKIVTDNSCLTNCDVCEYRHVCYDIESAHNHARKLVRKAKEQEQ